MPQIKIKDTKTGNWKSITISQGEFNSLCDLNESKTTKGKLLKTIEALNINPESKTFLESILNYSIDIGSTFVKVGGKVIKILHVVCARFPKALIGALIGLIIGGMLTKIPILGWVISWVAVPLAITVGVVLGAQKDLVDKKLQ